MQQSFFKDLVVVELASVMAGPAVGMFFAELGARVIKLENKLTGGDITRQWKMPGEPAESEVSAYFCCVNWRKEEQLVDLRVPEEREQIYAIMREADVVISNFKDSSARKLGMDYETLRTLNPSLIYGQLYAFGAEVNRPAFDVVMQAEAGFLYMTGEPDGKPVKMPVALIDLLAAHQLKEGILLALLHREKTGEGSFVQTSLLEAALASLANQATNWLMGGHIPQRFGSQHPNIAPYGDIVYSIDEKPIVLAVGSDGQFEKLCRAIGRPELVADPRFQTNTDRVANREALKEILKIDFTQKTRDEWIRLFEELGIPAGCIRTMPEVFEMSTAREMILEETRPGGMHTKRLRTVAFHWSTREET